MILHFSPHVPLDYVPHFLSREVAVIVQPLAATIVIVTVSPVFVKTLKRSCRIAIAAVATDAA